MVRMPRENTTILSPQQHCESQLRSTQLLRPDRCSEVLMMARMDSVETYATGAAGARMGQDDSGETRGKANQGFNHYIRDLSRAFSSRPQIPCLPVSTDPVDPSKILQLLFASPRDVDGITRMGTCAVPIVRLLGGSGGDAVPRTPFKDELSAGCSHFSLLLRA